MTEKALEIRSKVSGMKIQDKTVSHKTKGFWNFINLRRSEWQRETKDNLGLEVRQLAEIGIGERSRKELEFINTIYQMNRRVSSACCSRFENNPFPEMAGAYAFWGPAAFDFYEVNQNEFVSILPFAMKRLVEHNKLLVTMKEAEEKSYREKWHAWKCKANSVVETEEESDDTEGDDSYLSTLAEIPDMIHPMEMGPTFLDYNRLIDTNKQPPSLVSWSKEEQERFVALFHSYGKKFSILSQALPGRTVKDCIFFYYSNKKRLNLKLSSRRGRKKKKKKKKKKVLCVDTTACFTRVRRRGLSKNVEKFF
eukprot:TRINITY_DN30006_c0_g2_i1.p1 TRINITY_DN30006_c0_g2~~TRINITY_DN30006_c0_g2_i1.p1  ORF type:complete len:309 (-),score=83.49 TRINITY_DN30006_c0_g2_i1:81-1007(-)